MQLFVDLDLRQLVQSAGFKNVIDSIAFKRGDSQTLAVQFVQNGIGVELPAGTTGIFGIKKAGDYNGGYLVSALSWAKSGTGADTVYTFVPSFNTTELNDLIDNGGNPLPSVTCMAEIEWRTTAGLVTSTGTFTAIIADDVIKGDEGVPTDADPAYPLPGNILTKSLAGYVTILEGQQDYTVDLTALALAAAPKALVGVILPSGADSIRAHQNLTATTATSLALHLSAVPEASEAGGLIPYLLIA